MEICMLGIKAIWAILAGVVVVGGVGTYVFLETSSTDDQVVEANTSSTISASETTSQSSDEEPADEKVSTVPELNNDEVVKDDGASGEVAASSSNEPTKSWKMPAFDVLRVEPDGSTVIAGQGQPNTTLKVMNGDEVLNEVKIGSTGDFVVIFDQPLDSGDYQLTLKSEDEDGNALVSDETAIVSVPEEAGGQLLAMVSKPGQASRILAQPEAPVQAASADKVVEEVEVAAKIAAEVAEKVEVATNATITEDNVEVEKETAAVSVSEQESTVTAPIIAKEVVTAAPDSSEARTNVDEAMPKADADNASIADNDPVTEAQTIAEVVKSDEAPAVVEANVNDETPTMEQDVASKVVETVKELAAETAEGVAPKIVKTREADTMVESEVKTVEVSPQGSVIKTTEKTVAEVQTKNDSIVRIEAVEVEGDKLFVAGVASKGDTVRILVDGKAVGSVDVNRDGRFLIETEQELSVGSHMITAALEDKITKEIVLRAVVPFNRPEAESAAAIAPTDTSAENQEVAVANKGPREISVEDKPVMKTEVARNDVENSQPEGVNIKESEATINSSDSVAIAEEKVAKSETAMVKTGSETIVVKDEPLTIVQDTLTPAASQSVIIRKGDTLWQIARRTYGAGVRYTTIYLANQEQILNPDKIAPGQIFMVPEEALENAEELHLKRLQGN